jgi:hypothetical protein
MNGPGDYVADATEGIVRVEDLPPPRIERRSRVYRRRRCPFCGGKARRCGMAHRVLHDLGDARGGWPVDSRSDQRVRQSDARAPRRSTWKGHRCER